jgi:hypothetical protein
MQIDVTFDQAIGSLPAGFVAAIDYVVEYFDHLFTDAITINIDVGYGEVNGQPLGSGALGESITFLNSYNYSTLRGALAGDAKSADDATAVASLPGSDPISSTHTYWVSTAEQKALGLLAANSAAIDGYVGFSSTLPFDYNRNDGISAGFYDFIGTVEHEFSEVMGRVVLAGATIGSTPNGYEPLDLFDYSSPGTRRLVGTTAGYFSIDGGTTNLDNFNTNSGGDFGDWAASAGNDSALAFSNSGVLNNFSGTDVRAMDVLGYNRAPATSHDFNGDGISDILWRSSSTGAVTENMMNDITTIGSAGVGGDANWSVVGTGDFNGDGMTDVLWRNGPTGSVYEFLMNGSSVIATAGLGGDANWDIVGTGDFNNDGFADVLWRNGPTGSVYVFELNGTTVLGSAGLGGDANWSVIGTGDFNGDGKTDVLWRNNPSGAIYEFQMNGLTVTGTAGLGGDANWSVVGTGDFNGDGKTDVLWRYNPSGEVFETLMNGLTPISSASVGGSLNLGVIATGDYNGDGMTDILWRNSTTGAITENLMNGSTVTASAVIGGNLDLRPLSV